MGAIDSIDLFGMDELIIFSYYLRNKYHRAADIGANIGLHSVLLAKCGISVSAYEPDPEHFKRLQNNLRLNAVEDKCVPHMAAVSDRDGTTTFVRVLGNTTSSHILGAKHNAYGELQYFDVATKDVKAISKFSDLMKIDAEGHEAVILNALPNDAWNSLDAFVEVGSPENARSIFELNGSVNIFSQKTGWSRVENIGQMPVSYKEGGIFVTSKESMSW